jgi:hypothetical protein
MGLVVSVVLSVGVLVGLLVFAFVGGRSPVQKDSGPVPLDATTIPVPPSVPPATTMPATTAPPLPTPTTTSMPHSLVPENVEFAPRAVRVIDAAALVGVLPDAIDVTIESDEPDLRRFSGTYYYSFSVGFGWDPRIRSWAWTLDSVAAPGGNGYRGKTRAQLSYGNKEGTWDLSLNTGDPYPAPPVLLRATTGPLDQWSSVWRAKWTRVEPLGTTDSKRPLAMPLIKVRARGTGVIAQWT